MPEQPVTTKRQKPITLVKLIFVLLLFFTGVFVLWNRFGANSLTDPDNAVTPTITNNPSSQPSFGSMGTDEDIVELTIRAENYSYTPERVTVSKGDKVRLVLESTEGTHDLVIEDLGVEMSLVSDGHKAWVDFVADTVGEFTFYCSVENHQRLGMEGVLVVEE